MTESEEITVNKRTIREIKCPVSREIPEDVKTKLDEYLLRKRRKDS